MFTQFYGLSKCFLKIGYSIPKFNTMEQKKQWVEEYSSGKSVKEICSENHISQNSLYAWIKLFEIHKGNKNGTGISGHQLIALEQKNKHLVKFLIFHEFAKLVRLRQ